MKIKIHNFSPISFSKVMRKYKYHFSSLLSILFVNLTLHFDIFYNPNFAHGILLVLHPVFFQLFYYILHALKSNLDVNQAFHFYQFLSLL